MSKKKVVIFDDEDNQRQDWVERLREVPGFAEHFEPLRVDNAKFRCDLDILRRRREEARQGRNCPLSETFFDETSVFVVDYDLFTLGEETGEEVAYLARCFSGCGLIIAVNQFAREGFTFDLTLQGHPDSFADLNLLDEQIFESGLWSYQWGQFRPWYWPHLPTAVEAFERRASEAEENLDRRIFDFLDMPAEIREIFPVGALQFISLEGDATFREFVEKSGQALRWKDRIASDGAAARIAAARLFKCMERLVLPGQNILVDAAHLLERYPSLFRVESPEGLIGWQRVHELLAPGEESMAVDTIEKFSFARKSWLSRAAWYWPQVSEWEEIKEVDDPWAPRQRLAFCEDTSRFIHPDDAEEFVAKVDSPFVRRFVSTRNPRYGPKLQFAL